jgi:hypothetical protein
MTTDGRPQTPATADVRRAADKAPTDEPVYSEASAVDAVEEAGNKEGTREGSAEAESEELVAERLAESQDSVT